MSAIIGIKLPNKIEDIIHLQEILTEYGCLIKTRIEIHDMGEFKCLNYSIILIQVMDKVNEIYDKLAKYWQIQLMKF